MQAEEALIQAYRQAYLDLVRAIERKAAKGSFGGYERAMLTDVTRILQRLDGGLKLWIERELPKIVQGGADAAVNAMIEAGQDVPTAGAGFASVHQDSVRALANNLAGNLQEASQYVGRKIQDEWRQVALQAITAKQASGTTVRQAQKDFLQRIADNGLGAFKDSAGRTWRLDTYSEMVVRTTSREAANTGLMDRLGDMSRDLVRITSHSAPCGRCAPYAGRVYSVSGRDGRFPPLSVVPGFADGYKSIHPNCVHVLVAYIEEFHDVETDMQRSNAPFVDNRSKREIEVYNQGQEVKRDRMADRKQWERYRAWLPNDAPKTLAGFRRMKAANSPRYQELQQLYREARRGTVQAVAKKAAAQVAKTSPAQLEIARLLKGAPLNDRRALARHLLDESGMSNVSLSVRQIRARGQCKFYVRGDHFEVDSMALESTDTRPFRYQQKTVFHEATHARYNGVQHIGDARLNAGSEDWLQVEETVAECAAHHMLKAAGEVGEIAPSYSKYLAKVLPRLKRHSEFAECSTIADFGEMLAKHRYGDTLDASWDSLRALVRSTPLDLRTYAPHYEAYILANKESIAQAILDNIGTTGHGITHAQLVARVERSWTDGHKYDDPWWDSLAIAMNRMGVK